MMLSSINLITMPTKSNFKKNVNEYFVKWTGRLQNE